MAAKCDERQWEGLVAQVVKSEFTMSIRGLGKVLREVGVKMEQRDKEAVWEAFRLKGNLEDNPDALDDRLVTL